MLRLSDVSSGYGGQPVLKAITLEVVPGEILALIGVNGSGKSTLLKTALGLLPPQSGEIILNDKKLGDWGSKERSHLISLLDSECSVAFSTTVNELLDLAHYHRPPYERRDLRAAALRSTGMEDYRDRDVLHLSSGEKRRAFIAHTLSSGSKTIMMDEPFAHLDWSQQAHLASHLRTWRQRQGTTFILAIHELEWAMKVADRVCVIDRGSLLTVGDPEKVLRDRSVREVFAFRSLIDENPLDKSRRLTLSPANLESET